MKQNNKLDNKLSYLLNIFAILAKGADRFLTGFVIFNLILILLYACFGLWDTWRIYDGAVIDEKILQYKPILNEQNEEASFEELIKINTDVRAWLTLEQTNIDYPIVQGTDNVKYVNYNIYNEFSLSGSIFLDYRNAFDFSDTYSLLYGHHMEGDLMFGELDNFVDQDYFNQHQIGYLYLPSSTYQIDLFACLQVSAYDLEYFEPTRYSKSNFSKLIDLIKQDSLQYREIDLKSDDRLLVLSTCSDATTNGRILVVGRLVDISKK